MTPPDRPGQSPQAPTQRPAQAPRPSTAPARRAVASQSSTHLESQNDAFELLPDAFTDRYENAEQMTKSGLRLITKNAHTSKIIKEALKKYGLQFKLRKPEFYLSIAVKESGLTPTAVSGSDAKGLYQLKQDAINDIKRIFPDLQLTMDDIYNEDPEGFMQTRASTHNAMAGVLYWHLCRDNYVKKIGTFSAKDQDKFANIAYKMGPSQFGKLYIALGNPKTFKLFATAAAAQLIAKYPAALLLPAGKSEVIIDPQYDIPYTRYIKVKGDITGNIQINGQSFDAANLVQTLRYSEVISTLMHGVPVQILKKPEAPEKKDYFEVGKNGKWLWSIAKTIYDNLKLDEKVPYLKKQKSTTDKLKIFMDIVIRYNKEAIDNEEFQNIDPSDLKLSKGTKIYPPTLKYIKKLIERLENQEKPETKPRALTPKHILRGHILSLEGYPDTTFGIFTPGVKEKVTLRVKTKKGRHKKTGERLERSQVEVTIGDYTGHFYLRTPRSLSHGPIGKNTLWGNYDIDFDYPNNKIVIKPLKKAPKKVAPKKPTKAEKPEKAPATPEPIEAPEEALEISKPKERGADPFAKLDLSWPEGVRKRMPKPGEIIYVGKDGLKLMEEGKKLHGVDGPTSFEFKTPSFINPNRGKNEKRYNNGEIKKDKHGNTKWEIWRPMTTKIKGVVFHATEGLQSDEAVLFKRQNTHFIIKQNGEVWMVRNPKYYVNHTGVMSSGKYRAIWHGDGDPSRGRIGIEVETPLPERLQSNGVFEMPYHPETKDQKGIFKRTIKGKVYNFVTTFPRQSEMNKAWKILRDKRAYSEEQYKTINRFNKYLGRKYKLPKNSYITHAMTGVNGNNTYGRKSDPNHFDWARSELPDNERQVNTDIAHGKISGHLKRIDQERSGALVRQRMLTLTKAEYQDWPLYKKTVRVKVKRGVYKTVYTGLALMVEKHKGKWQYLPNGSFGATNEMYSGAKASQLLCEEYETCKNSGEKLLRRVMPIRAKAYGFKPDDLEKMLQNGTIKVDSDMNFHEAVLNNISPKATIDIPEKMRVVDVLYYSDDAKIHKGQIVIHRKLAYDIKKIFALAFKMKFPIQKAIPISHPWYKWDDTRSVTANNTSAFNYRTIAGKDKLSTHGMGMSIDINPRSNPYIGEKGKVTPRGAHYDPSKPGTLHADHPIVKEFDRLGWDWGGDWETIKDYQHFEKKI